MKGRIAGASWLTAMLQFCALYIIFHPKAAVPDYFLAGLILFGAGLLTMGVLFAVLSRFNGDY